MAVAVAVAVAGLCVLDVPHNALQTGNGTTDAPGSSTIKELIIDTDLRARGTVTASRFPSLPDGLHTVSMARWQRIPRGALISIGMLKHIRRFNAMGDAHFPRVLPETFEMTFLGCAATLMELRLASWSLTDGHIVHIARRCRVLRVLVIRQSCVGAPRGWIVTWATLMSVSVSVSVCRCRSPTMASRRSRSLLPLSSSMYLVAPITQPKVRAMRGDVC